MLLNDCHSISLNDPRVNCSSPKPAPMLSDRLDKYVIKGPLGYGAFGSVYLGETRIDGRRISVAIKAVRRSTLRDDVEVPMIYQEQMLTKYFTFYDGLGYFPQLVESFSDEHNYYLVSEYISGGTLRDEMRRSNGKIDPARVRFIMAQCLIIVEFMHMHGVMHRDIKPENILIDAVGNVVFTDFGLCRRFCSVQVTSHGVFQTSLISATNENCGTPGYMAPEIVFGRPYAFQADMYSLGCMMYEMVFGTLPFPSLKMKEVRFAMRNNLFCRPNGNRDVDGITRDLIARLLMWNPLERLCAAIAKTHLYFVGINWRLISSRLSELPLEWAPPVRRCLDGRIMDKRILLDKKVRPTGLHRALYDLQFTMEPRGPLVRRPSPPPTTKGRFIRKKAISRLEQAALIRRNGGAIVAIELARQQANAENRVVSITMASPHCDVLKRRLGEMAKEATLSTHSSRTHIDDDTMSVDQRPSTHKVDMEQSPVIRPVSPHIVEIALEPRQITRQPMIRYPPPPLVTSVATLPPTPSPRTPYADYAAAIVAICQAESSVLCESDGDFDNINLDSGKFCGQLRTPVMTDMETVDDG